MDLPLLRGRLIARTDDQWDAFGIGLPEGIQALAADTDDLTVSHGPLLARTAIAGHIDYASPVYRCAARDVQTAAADARDLPVGNIPILLLFAHALAQAHLGAIDRMAMPGHQHALIGVRGDEQVAAGAGGARKGEYRNA